MSQIYRAVGPLGEKFDFFRLLKFEAKSDFDHKTSKLKPHSVRASEKYLNDMNPIHGRAKQSIFRCSAKSFESYFNFKFLNYFGNSNGPLNRVSKFVGTPRT